MMPFISEELYQKFPSFEGKLDSICVNEYPTYTTEFDNLNVEN
jgi:valyl-tRNA synthetase